MSDFGYLLLLSIFGGVISLGGGLLVLFIKRWSVALSEFSIPFAAGVLLTVGLMGVLPEAVEQVGERAYLIVLISFLLAFIFEHFMFDLHHHDHRGGERVDKGGVWLVLIGDTIHNLIDGIAIAASFIINPSLGLMTAVSTFLHEVPHEIGDFGILLRAGWRRRNVLLANLASAMFTVLGAVGVYLWSGIQMYVGEMLAVAAGIFIYLGASDFLPRVEEQPQQNKAMFALLLGVVVMYVALVAVSHS